MPVEWWHKKWIVYKSCGEVKVRKFQKQTTLFSKKNFWNPALCKKWIGLNHRTRLDMFYQKILEENLWNHNSKKIPPKTKLKKSRKKQNLKNSENNRTTLLERLVATQKVNWIESSRKIGHVLSKNSWRKFVKSQWQKNPA